MKELKSKKTGKISIVTDEEWAAIVNKGVIDIKRFIVTDLRSMRTIVPKEEVKPTEVKKIKTKKE